MHRFWLLFVFALACWAVACGDGPTPTGPSVTLAPNVGTASDPSLPGGGATVGYVEDIKPILDADCVRCHSASNRSGRVDLSSYSQVLRTLVPGNQNSLLIVVSRPGGSMYDEWRGSAGAKADLVRRWVVDFQARQTR